VNEIDLTAEEQRAIAALKKLAKSWPRTLQLFSWSGSLRVLKPGGGRTMETATVAYVSGIPNSGGDPNGDDVA